MKTAAEPERATYRIESPDGGNPEKETGAPPGSVFAQYYGGMKARTYLDAADGGGEEVIFVGIIDTVRR